jgi:hypothetical protein
MQAPSGLQWDARPQPRSAAAVHPTEGRKVQAPAAHHLVGAEQEADGGEAAPHMHQPAEREEQEDRHSEDDMEQERPRQAGQCLRIDRSQRDDALRPIGQDQHHAAVGVSP